MKPRLLQSLARLGSLMLYAAGSSDSQNPPKAAETGPKPRERFEHVLTTAITACQKWASTPKGSDQTVIEAAMRGCAVEFVKLPDLMTARRAQGLTRSDLSSSERAFTLATTVAKVWIADRGRLAPPTSPPDREPDEGGVLVPVVPQGGEPKSLSLGEQLDRAIPLVLAGAVEDQRKDPKGAVQ